MAKKKQAKKLSNVSIIVIIAVTAFIVFFFVSFIKLNAEKKQKQQQYNELSSILESQTQANSELNETIKNGIQDELAEDYAQKDGYVNPNQHIYIDITPGAKN